MLESLAKFALAYESVVDFSLEESFKFTHSGFEFILLGVANNEQINIAFGIFFPFGKRAIEISILNTRNFRDCSAQNRYEPCGFEDNSTDFIKKRVTTIQVKIFLIAAQP